MNRAFLSLSKSISVAVLAVSSFASSVYANEVAKPAKADPVKGEALYTNGDAARGIAACASCHGAAGNSTIAANPKLSAQHEAYLVKQLTDFTGDTRKNAVMTAFAKAMTAEDMKNVAAYLSVQKSKPGTAKNKDIVELGKQIYRGGIAEKNVPACAGCHSPNGAGIPAQFPRIAGQHQDYTIAQLTGFQNGSRKDGAKITGARLNSAQMMTIAKKMSEDEIKAVADYVAGLK
ncbi:MULTISPECIES: c-type cytochrome [Undibacterium]|jgi:cytochrome c553|uniref:Cytochrome c4 n=1 Tax=Undibacterium umbellatum TaxID=2762300 RepID=A0ABR6Z730_9BURK|nr:MULTISPECIES: c-type cytochrome [Undibacterium]MBC3907581.1 cytochrome c4 [Undibacterium umbellatum]MDP1977752.1 c-type cytochrome [Undibacterium sp.]